MAENGSSTHADLAALSNIDPEVLTAILQGELGRIDIVAMWPTGGSCMIQTAGQLAGFLRTRDDIARFGIDAVRDAEDADRHERQRLWRVQNPSRDTAPRTKPLSYHVYRLFDTDDRLLYIGIARNMEGRLKAHMKRWGDVIHRHESVVYSDHATALSAEAAAIAAECPPFNHAGVGA